MTPGAVFSTGQREYKLRAAARSIAGTDAAAMRFYDSFANGEPKAGAAPSIRRGGGLGAKNLSKTRFSLPAAVRARVGNTKTRHARLGAGR